MKKDFVSDLSGKIAYWRSDVLPFRHTLFFLHGLTGDHTMFEPQISAFRDDFNIIAWDAPAHGESRPCTEFTYKNAAEGIRQILEKCGIGRVILIGQSMGGYIAQAFICRYPDMAAGFVAIDSTPYGDYYSRSDMWWLRQIEWMSMMFPKRLLKSAIAWQNSLTKAGRENMSKMIKQFSKPELCRLMKIGYAGFLEDNRPLKITCPTILLVGEKYRTGKVKTYNREWARRTGFPLIWIPNAAHNSNVDNPGAVNGEIEKFIKGIKYGRDLTDSVREMLFVR